MAFVVLAIMYGPVQLNAQSTLTNVTDNKNATIKGLTAYFSGDFETAFREWKLSAEKVMLGRNITWVYCTVRVGQNKKVIWRP